MADIAIHGLDCLLGSYFAARFLQTCHDRIFYLAEPDGAIGQRAVLDPVIYASLRFYDKTAVVLSHQEIESRLRQIPGSFDALSATGIAALWCFTSPTFNRTSRATIDRLLSACNDYCIKEFNYVEFDVIGVVDELYKTQHAIGEPNREEAISAGQVAQYCRERSIPCRIFRTSLIAGSGHPALEHSSMLSRFLSILHSLKAEIEERLPQYFDFRTVRCFAPANATLNLISAIQASDLLLGISRNPATTGSCFSIVSPGNTRFSDLCERIGIAYSIGLLSVDDFTALNAVDRIFYERLVGLEQSLVRGALQPPATEAYRTAGLSLEDGAFDEDGQIVLFERLRRDQDEDLAAGKCRAEELPARLRRKTVIVHGSELTYYIGGEKGTPIVVLNALGQGLEYWYPLLDNLIGSHRVIIWEPRGTVAPLPPFGLADQVDDVDAILQHEAIESCHFVGWCTGPKVAINFYHRRPSAVRSMVFLNATFKCEGSPEELDSPYEHNLESLCRMLMRKPAIAASVMKTFTNLETEEADGLEGNDGEQASVNALSKTNFKLKPYIVAPFQTEETTRNYAQQLIDFWRCDVRPRAAEVEAPVLLIAAQYDRVATPAASQDACEFLPNARYVYLKGATHYCMYDQPKFVANLLITFFENPDSYSSPEPGENMVLHAAQDLMIQAG